MGDPSHRVFRFVPTEIETAEILGVNPIWVNNLEVFRIA